MESCLEKTEEERRRHDTAVHGAKRAIITTSLHTKKESVRESGRGKGGEKETEKRRKKEGGRKKWI